MLPNRMTLSKQTEERLRRLKQYTGINPNVSARIAFFRSYENGFAFTNDKIKLDGSMTLDKVTWLGDTLYFVESLLKGRYPNLQRKGMTNAWAAHVEDGTAGIYTSKSLPEFLLSLDSGK